MKKQSFAGLATMLLLVGMIGNANATAVSFFGEDLGGGRVYSDAAHEGFMSNLTGVGTEDFERFIDGDSGPIDLDFGVAGTATLSGSGAIEGNPSHGRWATSGEHYWETNSNFNILFSTAISAFGFYGTDIGDFGGAVILNYTNGNTTTVNIGNTVGAADGSFLYFGFYETDKNLAFTSISFSNTNGDDWFGFDDMTIGTFEQLTTNETVPVPTPEPSTILLIGAGLFGLAGYSRKRFNQKS